MPGAPSAPAAVGRNASTPMPVITPTRESRSDEVTVRATPLLVDPLFLERRSIAFPSMRGNSQRRALSVAPSGITDRSFAASCGRPLSDAASIGTAFLEAIKGQGL